MNTPESGTATADQAVSEPALFPAIPLLEQTQILFEREGGLTECYVPASLIDHEEVPVKEEWAESIARQMRQISAEKGGSGQKTAIRLGWIEGEQKFRIIDGFHRDAALIENEEGVIYATVERTTWDELYDNRIFTAKDHAHVRFSRVVKWIQEVWEHSGLSNNLSVEQAILLYRYESSGKNLGIDAESAEAAKQWIARKETQWDIQAMTIHSYLRTADNVDPLLVNAAREKKRGDVLDAPTQQILKVFSDALPNAFELQNIVWSAAKEGNLSAAQVKALCKLVVDKDGNEAREAILAVDLNTLSPDYGKTKARQLRRASDPRYKGAAVFKGLEFTVSDIAQRVDLSLEREEEVDESMRDNLEEALKQVAEMRKRLGRLGVRIAKLKERGPQVDTEIVEAPPSDDAEDTSAEHVEIPSRSLVEKAYRRHKDLVIENAERKVRPRLRRYGHIELPAFGVLSAEDWQSIEPHYRLALALAGPSISNGIFKDAAERWNETLKLSNLVPANRLPLSKGKILPEIKPYMTMLTDRAPQDVGRIIERDQASGQYDLTRNGRIFLAEIIKNVQLSVDDSK